MFVTLPGHQAEVNCVKFMQSEDIIASGDQKGILQVRMKKTDKVTVISSLNKFLTFHCASGKSSLNNLHTKSLYRPWLHMEISSSLELQMLQSNFGGSPWQAAKAKVCYLSIILN